jgi:hypothetical protein
LSPLSTSDANSFWYADANLPAGHSNSATTSYTFPVTKVRAIIASVTGSMTVATLQGFMVG